VSRPFDDAVLIPVRRRAIQKKAEMEWYCSKNSAIVFSAESYPLLS
jgi:hypothetical protein